MGVSTVGTSPKLPFKPCSQHTISYVVCSPPPNRSVAHLEGIFKVFLEDAFKSGRRSRGIAKGPTLQWRHGHQGDQVKAMLKFLPPLFTRNSQRQNVPVTFKNIVLHV